MHRLLGKPLPPELDKTNQPHQTKPMNYQLTLNQRSYDYLSNIVDILQSPVEVEIQRTDADDLTIIDIQHSLDTAKLIRE